MEELFVMSSLIASVTREMRNVPNKGTSRARFLSWEKRRKAAVRTYFRPVQQQQ